MEFCGEWTLYQPWCGCVASKQNGLIDAVQYTFNSSWYFNEVQTEENKETLQLKGQSTSITVASMSAMASQITSLTIVYSTVYSGADQRKHQSSASLAFLWGTDRWPANSPHNGPVTRKMFPFDDVIIKLHYYLPATIIQGVSQNS